MKSIIKKPFLYRLISLGVSFSLLIFLSVKGGPIIIAMINSPAKLKHWLEFYGPFSMLIYIALLTLVMIMTPIPSEALLFGGGYLYGAIAGAACTWVVISLGTLFSFWLARYFGMPLMKNLIPSKYLQKFDNIQQKPLFDGISFMLFLIPGFPKDALTYVVGLTTTKFLKSLLIILAARTPSIIISSYIGANLREQNYQLLWIELMIVCVLVILGFIFKDKKILNKTVSRFTVKVTM